MKTLSNLNVSNIPPSNLNVSIMTVCSLLRKIQGELNKINEGKGYCGVLAAGVSCFYGAEVHLNENVFQAVFSDGCPTIATHSDEYNKHSVVFDGVKIFTLVEKDVECEELAF